jgi:hypothetical protein
MFVDGVVRNMITTLINLVLIGYMKVKKSSQKLRHFKEGSLRIVPQVQAGLENVEPY